MKKYLLYIILITFMMSCFLVSGLFFMNSGIVDIHTGIDNENSIHILAEINALPLIYINPYNIIFCASGKIADIKDKEFDFVPFYGDKESFSYEGNLSNFSSEEEVRIYYNYLPEGGKKIVRIRKKN